jgi:hypothetical protein
MICSRSSATSLRRSSGSRIPPSDCDLKLWTTTQESADCNREIPTEHISHPSSKYVFIKYLNNTYYIQCQMQIMIQSLLTDGVNSVKQCHLYKHLFHHQSLVTE